MAKACHQLRQRGTRCGSEHRARVPKVVESQIGTPRRGAGLKEVAFQRCRCEMTTTDSREHEDR